MCSVDTYHVCRVATNLAAYQSSVHQDGNGNYYPASYAVDSHRHTDYTAVPHSCSISSSETNPWWVVDLGVPLTVTGIVFTNIDRPGTWTIEEDATKMKIILRVLT